MTEEEKLNRQLEKKKKKYRDYSEIQLDINRLNQALKKCIEIVDSSVENNSTSSKLQTLEIENDKAHKDSEKTVLSELTGIRAQMAEINEHLDALKKDKEE